jgi:fermentation-respiration switch protein FrsA (DUF1100 family)
MRGFAGCGRGSAAVLAVLLLRSSVCAQAPVPSLQSITIRGHQQTLHLYGDRSGYPVIVSSGDGGWIHLGPHVADTLAASGFFVIGFDVKAYLEAFTTRRGALTADDVPGDFTVLVNLASGGNQASPPQRKPLLIGVSEGAGLSVLAAAAAPLKSRVAGVICLGMPDVTELGWRWKDTLTYLTHTVPDEPTFSTAAVAPRLAPLPLAAIHSTRDEFVPVAVVQHLLDGAAGPHRLWVLNATDHRFSGNVAELDRRLLEAIDWVRSFSR